MSLNSNNSTRPREISSRSANVNISRTTGNPSPPNTKITCYDRLNLPGRVTAEKPLVIVVRASMFMER